MRIVELRSALPLQTGRLTMSDTAILTVGDQRIELPIHIGSEGERSDRHHQTVATNRA